MPEPLCLTLLKSATETNRTPTVLSMRHMVWHRRPTGLLGLRKRINSVGSGSRSSTMSFAPPSDMLRTKQEAVKEASSVRMIDDVRTRLLEQLKEIGKPFRAELERRRPDFRGKSVAEVAAILKRESKLTKDSRRNTIS